MRTLLASVLAAATATTLYAQPSITDTRLLAIAGHDPQLEKAVEVLMAELKKNPPVKPKRPAFPNKVVP